jgi:hypothetical protein
MLGGGRARAGQILIGVLFFSGGGVRSEGTGKTLTDRGVKYPVFRQWFTVCKMKRRAIELIGYWQFFWQTFWAVTRFTIFSGLVVLKKEVFRVSTLISANCLFFDFIFSKGTFLPRPLGSFFPKDLDSRLGGCGTRGIDYLFFESTRRIRRKDSKLV